MNESLPSNLPYDPIRKSDGVNASERKLISLCRHTFLDLWSFPNPHRNQGAMNAEICDLLVICEPHIIIFSDKTCEYNTTVDPDHAWKRWYKKAITASIKQLYGAERWIRQHPDRMFTDPQCRQPLPLSIPQIDVVQFHRVVVAGGASAACKREHGGSGSLLLFGKPKKDKKEPGHSVRFSISDFGKPNEFVHVIDEVALGVLLDELDTITDFIRYLTKKEQFVNSPRFGYAEGEENLLAYYLSNINTNDEHDFVFSRDSDSLVMIDDTLWESIRNNSSYIRKKDADEDSYKWDQIIELAGKHIAAGTMRLDEPLSYEDQQIPLRTMARESRFSRRILESSLSSFLKITSPDARNSRVVLSSHNSDTVYVFCLVPYDTTTSDTEYWEYRKHLTYCTCLVVAKDNRNIKLIIGISTESGYPDKRSWDFCSVPTSSLTEEAYTLAGEIQGELNIRNEGNITCQNMSYQEYPEPEIRGNPVYSLRNNFAAGSLPTKKPGRNLPCPCGSGSKYKKCCGSHIK